MHVSATNKSKRCSGSAFFSLAVHPSTQRIQSAPETLRVCRPEGPYRPREVGAEVIPHTSSNFTRQLYPVSVVWVFQVANVRNNARRCARGIRRENARTEDVESFVRDVFHLNPLVLDVD